MKFRLCIGMLAFLSSIATAGSGADGDFVPGEIILSGKLDRRAPSSGRSESELRTLLAKAAGPSFKIASLHRLAKARPQSNAARSGGGLESDVFLARLSDAGTDVPALCALLASHPDIAFAEPNWRTDPVGAANDPYFSSSGSWGQPYADQWGLHAMRVAQAWDQVPSTNPVVLAVLDTGLDLAHPELAANLWSNPGEIPGNGQDDDTNGFVDDVHGWNTEAGSGDLTDTDGHGTSVAGVACAVRDNGVGMAGIAGLARLMVVKHANGNGTVADLIEAVAYAVENGADVINISYSTKYPSPPLEAVIEQAGAAGVPVFASAGNSGNDLPIYPAAYPVVIAIGATGPADLLSSFSNRGNYLDVLAPGEGILTLRASGTSAGHPVGADLQVSSGTSYACPAAAGVGALLLQRDPTLTPEEVRHILRASAADVMDPGWDALSNYGRIDAEAALLCPKPLTPTLTDLSHLCVLSGAREIHGSVGLTDFASYALEYGPGVAPTSFVAIVISSNPPSGSVLGAWNTTNVPDGIYTLRLTANQQSGRSYTDRAAVRVGNHFLEEIQPWPTLSYPDTDTSLMTAADMDRDGAKDIVTVSFRIVFVRKSNGDSLPGWPINLPTAGHALGFPAVGDLDGDAYPEIGIFYAPTNNAWSEVLFKIWRHDGTDLPGWPIRFDTARDDNTRWTTPVFADVDQDGTTEIIYVSTTNFASQALVNVVRPDHTPLPGWPVSLPTGTVTSFISPAIGDLDGDGKLDVAVMTKDLKIFLLSHAGIVMPGWPVSLGTLVNRKGSVVFSDFDHDGRLELFAASYSGHLALYERDGSLMPGWPRYMGGGVSPPLLADLDGDGDVEVIVGGGGGWRNLPDPSSSGSLWVMHHDGTDAAGWPRAYPSTTVRPGAVADMDGDGFLDVCAAEYQKMCHAWDREGNDLVHLGFPLQFSILGGSPPIVEDVTGDGRLDLVTGNGRVAVWPLPLASALQLNPYPQAFGSANRQNRYTPWTFTAPVDLQVLDKTDPTAAFEIEGDHFLAGIAATLGTNTTDLVTSMVNRATFSPPAGMPPGRYDIRVQQPGSGSAIATGAVLVLSSLHADDDGDHLPNDWELRYGFDPVDGESVDPEHSWHGDADHDGIINFLELAYEGMGASPVFPDADLPPAGKIDGDRLIFDYAVNTNRTIIFTPQMASDLNGRWVDGSETNIIDESLPGGTSPFLNRRASVPLGSNDHLFLRLLVTPE